MTHLLERWLFQRGIAVENAISEMNRVLVPRFLRGLYNLLPEAQVGRRYAALESAGITGSCDVNKLTRSGGSLRTLIGVDSPDIPYSWDCLGCGNGATFSWHRVALATTRFERAVTEVPLAFLKSSILAALLFASTVTHANPAPDSPEAQLANLISMVGALGSPWGSTNSLETNLQYALDAMKKGSNMSACIRLNDFVNEALAKAGKKVTLGQAGELIERVKRIQAILGCS
jgi:hypothetical protein